VVNAEGNLENQFQVRHILNVLYLRKNDVINILHKKAIYSTETI